MRWAACLAWVTVAAVPFSLPATEAKGSSLELGPLVAAEGFTLVGDDLVYFDFEHGAWELRERDLATGKERTLASVPYGDGTQIRSLRANERWAVWSDDRSGNPAMYAIERATGWSSRVSDQAGDGRHIHLQDDRIAFDRSGQLLTLTLPNGGPRAANVTGQAFHPVLSEDAIVFVRLEANETWVASSAPGRPEVILERTRGSYPKNLRADAGAVAWLTGVLWDPEQPGHGFEGEIVQFAEGSLGPVRNLTASPVPASSLLIQDGYVCWLERGLARCYHWKDGAWLETQAQGTSLSASATHVATFAPAKGQDYGSLIVRAWDAPAADSNPIAWGPWPLAVAVLLAIAAQVRR